MVLPLLDENNKPVGDAYRLIFADKVTVYYSYQHPIAFASRERFVTRYLYWTRRRENRRRHIELIALDISNKSLAFYVSADFFADLQEEFAYHGFTVTGGKPSVSEKKINPKRRVVL